MMPHQIVADVAAERRRALHAEALLYGRAREGRPYWQIVTALVLRLLPPRRFRARQSVTQGLAESSAGRVLRGAVPVSETAAGPRGGQR
ncbi:hypothetical protein EV643_112288 [Kribbella sp. VKM Ac-2527]|uniref:Uncharacterized protein n=1 Tax=Kribbella caucasensis TaxID=2512215 RepID=A0A4V3C9J9_9ACTN|nr:hypothetical protein EV643_112288 [Kribbella sp. VKM Ac-2527]